MNMKLTSIHFVMEHILPDFMTLGAVIYALNLELLKYCQTMFQTVAV